MMFPSLFLYNTETRKKEEIKLSGSSLKMYTCGPTIYNFVHIGNLRTFVFEDLLRRVLCYFQMPLIQVMNLTDVDDKTIKGALEKGVSLKEFVEPYRKAFFEDLESLFIEKAEHYPLATDYIPHMTQMIEQLLEKGIAYQGKDQSIYFNIHKCSHYGKLSHLKLDDLKVNASDRIHSDEYDKERAADFVLWKAYDPQRDGDIFWETPFGKGRPGWHIECSAMARAILGETIDLHAGGVDLIFPHHENEIAQSECCSGKLFAKHWVHGEHLLVNGKKMSKSLGNFYTLRDLFAKGYTGKEIRFLLLQAHYRTQLNFTFEGLDAARHSLARIEDAMVRLSHITQQDSAHDITPLLQKAKQGFQHALADDLNISLAWSVIFECIRELNTLCDQKALSHSQAKEALSLFKEFDKVVACLPFERDLSLLSSHVTDLLAKREEARAQKQWKQADHFRDLITKEGYLIEDTKEGPQLKPIIKS